MPYASPALLKATLRNFMVQVLFQKTIGSNLVDAVSADPDTAKQFRMIANLNRAGRNYLVRDRGNKRKGVHMLGSLSDDLDCLFFHLREDPVLCSRNSAVSEPPRKKRKTEDGSET